MFTSTIFHCVEPPNYYCLVLHTIATDHKWVHYVMLCVAIHTLFLPTMSQNKQFVVAIEGNISSGKSTFCQAIFLSYKTIVKVVFEQVNKRLLSNFLKNPKRNAAAMQLVRMGRRLDELASIKHYIEPTALIDRSLLGDICFALKQFLDKNMNVEDMYIYSEEMALNSFANSLQTSDLNAVIYLHSSPGLCRQRVEKRGDVDSATQQDYLNDIDDLHFYGIIYLIVQRLKPVYVITSKQLHNKYESERARKSVELFNLILKNKKKYAAEIHFVDSKQKALEMEQYSSRTFSVILWDNPEDLEIIPPDHLPRLKREWRKRHSQVWKDMVMDSLVERNVIYFVKKEKQTLFELFEQLSSSWDDLLQYYADKKTKRHRETEETEETGETGATGETEIVEESDSRADVTINAPINHDDDKNNTIM